MGNLVETVKKQVAVAVPVIIMGVISYSLGRFLYDRFATTLFKKQAPAIEPVIEPEQEKSV